MDTDTIIGGKRATPHQRMIRVRILREVADAGGGTRAAALRLGISVAAVSQFLTFWGYDELREHLRANSSSGVQVDRIERLKILAKHGWSLKRAAEEIGITYVGLYCWVQANTGSKIHGAIQDLKEELEMHLQEEREQEELDEAA